jgi:hypothetical protein
MTEFDRGSNSERCRILAGLAVIEADEERFGEDNAFSVIRRIRALLQRGPFETPARPNTNAYLAQLGDA